MVECNVDDCGEDATFFYTWAWGEEGACCNGHRAHLESKSAQLNRQIAFTPIGDESGSTATVGRRDYKAPKIRDVSPELGKLRMQNAELVEQLKKSSARVGELEVRVYELEAMLDEARARPSVSVIEGSTSPSEGLDIALGGLSHATTTPSRKDPDEQKRSQRK